MSDQSPPPGASWSGYTAIDEPDEHRWRFRYPDHRRRLLTVEITFPDSYELRHRLRTVAAITRAVDTLRHDDSSA